jgi:hypothetical protein
MGPEVKPKRNKSTRKQDTTDKQGKSEKPLPPASAVKVRVTLLIPQDEYESWKSELPAFVEIRTEVLDNDARGWFRLR